MRTRLQALAWAGGVCLAAAGLSAQTYTFGTLAGNPSIVDSNGVPVGDFVDGTNSAARFNFPQSAAVDGEGDLYVADTVNNAIRKVARAGDDWVVTTVAGSGPTDPGSADGTNGQAQFNFPQGLAVDQEGNLYVADLGNHTIRKITPVGADWVVTTIAGAAGVPGANDGPGSTARFNLPAGVAVDGATNVYVADYLNNSIRKLTPAGTDWVVSTIAGGGASAPGSADGTNAQARFNGPGAVAADSAGRVYVSDWYNSTVRMITPAGTNFVVTTIAGKAGESGWVDGVGSDARFTAPLGGVGVDHAGTLYVTDAAMIRRITPVGTNWTVTTLGGAYGLPGYKDGIGSTARFYWAMAVQADSAGNLYVADRDNHAIRIGVPSSSAPPRLQIVREMAGVVLSWPLSAAMFVPETASAPLAGATWTPLNNGVSVVGDHFVLTNNPSGATAAFRLRLPQ